MRGMATLPQALKSFPCQYENNLLYNSAQPGTWDTGIRGLMGGMETLPKELLEVRDKVGRSPGELGVSKSVECDIFPSVL